MNSNRFRLAHFADNEGNIHETAIIDNLEKSVVEILIPFGVPILPIGA